MKLNKLAIAAVVAGVTVFGLANQAKAGEGGAAGSAAFTTTSGAVTGAAVSAAVGKNDAASSATYTSGVTVSTSLGSAGLITVTPLGGTTPFLTTKYSYPG